MEIIISSNDIKNAIANVLDSADNSGTLVITRNLLFRAEGDTLTITATDLAVTSTVSVKCTVKKSGAITIPAKFVSQAVRVMKDGQIAIAGADEPNNCFCTITSADTRYRVSTLPSDTYPLPQAVTGDSFTVPARAFSTMLSMVSYAASTDQTRKRLCGVHFACANNEITMVATDGRRLSFISYEMGDVKPFAITIPSKSVNILSKVFRDTERVSKDVTITVSLESAKFEIAGDCSIQTKLLAESYPDFHQVMPNSFTNEVTMDREALLTAIRQASITVSGNENGHIKLSLKDNTAVVSGDAQQLATAESSSARASFPIKYDGPAFQVALSHSLLADALNALCEDEIVFRFSASNLPVEIGCSVPFRGIIMPLRIG